MGRRSKQTFLQRCTDGQKAHDERCSTSLITNYKRNANQNYSEISPHSSQNGYHQKIHKQYMLERVGREQNLPTLLIGMEIGTATVENSMEIP